MICLDTDVVSAAMRDPPPLHLIRRLAAVPKEEQCTTAVTLAELVYGAAKRQSAAIAADIERVISSAGAVMAFDRQAAEVYGPVRAQLEREGRPLAHPDLQIAAIALARDLTLITGNTRHFDRVPGLRVENWLAAAT